MKTTHKIITRDGELYLMVPDLIGNPATLLITRGPGGDPVIPSTWCRAALGALYDEYQCNDHLEEGAEFEFEGRIVARCEGVHVVPIGEVPADPDTDENRDWFGEAADAAMED